MSVKTQRSRHTAAWHQRPGGVGVKPAAPLSADALLSESQKSLDYMQHRPIANVKRWCQALRYFRPEQLARRAAVLIRRQCFSRIEVFINERNSRRVPFIRSENHVFDPTIRQIVELSRRKSCFDVRTVVQGRFRFLNRERDLGFPISWHGWPEGQPDSALWNFHLHYQHYLLDLYLEAYRCEDQHLIETVWTIIEDWIDKNPLSNRRVMLDAWHPYCISQRLPIWILLWHMSPPPAEMARRQIARSVYRQTRFLEQNLELDIGGNHLLANVRALLFASGFFAGKDADRWIRKSSTILSRELTTQVLPHGEHFERSPMYHLEVLAAILDISDVTRDLAPRISEMCRGTADRMARFLQQILHPDGQVPLFADSSLDDAAYITAQLRRIYTPKQGSLCGMLPLECFGHKEDGAAVVGDYWTWRDGSNYLILDAGAVGADHLPAHAHSDLLTFEASLDAKRLFVDSGVYHYHADAMRRYCRSTQAHNVLQIDDTQQCDTWSRFRMGYRGRPKDVAWGVDHGFSWVRASHDAYRRCGVPSVSRWIACRRGGPWLCVDQANGLGRHRLTNWLHFHPDTTIDVVSANEITIQIGEVLASLRFLTPGVVSRKTGWYCPQFGLRFASPIVTWTAEVQMPAICSWSLTWGAQPGAAALEFDELGRPILIWSEPERYLCLRPFSTGNKPRALPA